MSSGSFSLNSRNITTFAAFERAVALSSSIDHEARFKFNQSLFANLAEWSSNDITKLSSWMTSNLAMSSISFQQAYKEATANLSIAKVQSIFNALDLNNQQKINKISDLVHELMVRPNPSLVVPDAGSLNISTFAAFGSALLAPNSADSDKERVAFYQSLFINISKWSQDDLAKLHDFMQGHLQKSSHLLQTVYNHACPIGAKQATDRAVALTAPSEQIQLNQLCSLMDLYHHELSKLCNLELDSLSSRGSSDLRNEHHQSLSSAGHELPRLSAIDSELYTIESKRRAFLVEQCKHAGSVKRNVDAPSKAEIGRIEETINKSAAELQRLKTQYPTLNIEREDAPYKVGNKARALFNGKWYLGIITVVVSSAELLRAMQNDSAVQAEMMVNKLRPIVGLYLTVKQFTKSSQLPGYQKYCYAVTWHKHDDPFEWFVVPAIEHSWPVGNPRAAVLADDAGERVCDVPTLLELEGRRPTSLLDHECWPPAIRAAEELEEWEKNI